MSIYIHIPFCTKICSYCDFCKLLKNEKWIDLYLNALEKEINQNYHNEEINTLYIGGGTPSCLSIKQLEKLFSLFQKFNLNPKAEITFEANSEDLTKEKIILLKKYINRLSIGVQTFDSKILNTLDRRLNTENIKLAIQTFENVSLDLMYGFHGQTFQDLKSDLKQIIALKPKHISAYCLILEPHTKLYIKNYEPLSDGKERKMYDLIVQTLKDNNYIQYELSNFSQKGYQSKHNKVYWNNQNYYGFGLGASGYIDNIRYENTRNLNEYLKGNFLKEKHKLSLDETIQNEFILGLRKTDGLNKQNFLNKYHVSLKSLKPVQKLLKQNILKESKDNIYINRNYLYTSNEILLNFIDFSLHKH